MDLAEGRVAALDYLNEHPGWSAIPYAIAPRRPGDLPAYYASAEQAHKLLGWSAKRSLDEMCASTWRYCQAAI